jgi:4'-phosphopantetheinyl transferase
MQLIPILPWLDWPPLATAPALTPTAVHVWAFPLDLSPERIAELTTTLSSDERERAGRFSVEQLRHRFIAGRGGMRTVIADYLQVAPAELEFSYTSKGKPAFAAPSAIPLHFNLAHSHELALLSVTRRAEVGVDVEKIRPFPNAEDIAERFFSAGEIAALKILPPTARDAAFFHLWTRKEAWLKATGDGIAESLSKFEVEFLPGERPGGLAIAGDPAAGKAWSIWPLRPADGFLGALAIQAWDVELSCWRAKV